MTASTLSQQAVPAISSAISMTNPTTSSSSRPPALDLKGKHLHFVGIGGCGMSGLARIARQAGAICTGSDMAASHTIDALQKEGFPVSLRQAADTVPPDCQLLVISAAIKDDHPEVLEARRRGIPVLKYAQLLGQLMIGRRALAVAGTHGKSSTTSMLAHILIQAGLDPSFIVGATCQQIGGGARSGKSDLLVAEACEYDRSFHNFHPTWAVILNVEEDHLDTYGTLDAIVESFHVFAQKLPPHGSLLINHEMPHRLAIVAGLSCRVETIGFAPQADWQVRTNGDSCPAVRLFYQGQEMLHWTSPLPGEHMAYNAAAAAVLAHWAGAPWSTIAPALESFRGLDRRMQFLGRRRIAQGWVSVVDDYGHHPTEIDTTLRALKRYYKPHRLICVFQPHQHSRTRFLLEQFAASFSQADLVIVPQIYFVRDSEQERHAVTAADLVDRLRKRGRHAMHLYPFEAIVEQLELIAQDGDLIVTMGAGDVWKVAHDFLGPNPA